MTTTTKSSLNETIRNLRDQARKEALECCKFARSRGTRIIFANSTGRCEGRLNEPFDWDGSMTSLRRIIAEAEASPQCTELWADGGFDGSMDGSTLRDFLSGADDYEPCVSGWQVQIWSRQEGFLF